MLTSNPRPPSPPPVNTKVECLVEAMESLMTAVTLALREPPPKNAYMSVKAAREEMAEALRAFLLPTLRVVGGTDTERRIPIRNANEPVRFEPPKKQ